MDGLILNPQNILGSIKYFPIFRIVLDFFGFSDFLDFSDFSDFFNFFGFFEFFPDFLGVRGFYELDRI